MTADAAPVFGIVGGLAAFPRRIARREVEARGGRMLRGITRQTTHVVFGRGLLDRLAEPAIEARVAAERAAGRALLSENGFLRGLDLLEPPAAADIGRGALIEQSRLPPRHLDLLALFDAFESHREPFSFRDVILARKYAGLISGGATWGAIARSIHRAGPPVSLTAKSLQVGARTIRACHDGRVAELDGQFVLDLRDPAPDLDEVFAEAEEAETAGDLEAAAALYARCLALDPGDAVAAFNRANCLRELGRNADAEQAYFQALRADPGFAEAWFNLAALLKDRGRTDAARGYLERAVALDRDYADAVYNLASLAFDADDYPAARRWWQRYLELDDTSEWARLARHGLRYIAARLGLRAG